MDYTLFEAFRMMLLLIVMIPLALAFYMLLIGPQEKISRRKPPKL